MRTHEITRPRTVRRSPRMTALGALAIAAMAAGGCAAGAADKSGGEKVTLRFASIDGQDRASEFVQAIEEASDGRLLVDVTWVYGDGATDAEAHLIEAIAAGEIDGGWPSTRAFASAGIPGLAAVEAPLTITNYDAQAALLEGDARETILSALEGTDVVGVGLAGNPLRRPFAADSPLLSPEDWQGKRFRAYNSITQDKTISALGANPVNLSFSWIDEMRRGDLDGVEFDVRGYWMNGYGTEAANVASNVVLWPKISVLALSRARWDTLTVEQREWIEEAAEQTTSHSITADYAEDDTAADLCAQGVKFFEATPAQLDAMTAAVAPVIEALASDEKTAQVLEVVLRAAEANPGLATVNVPPSCSSGGFVPGVSSPVQADGVAPIPDGVYRSEILADDIAEAGLSNGPGWTGTWTLTIDDGTYALTCQPIDAPGHDCGNVPYGEDGFTFDTVLEAGRLLGDQERAVFAYDAEVHSEMTGCEVPCFPLPDVAFRWTIAGDQLVFVDDGNATPTLTYTINPWTRIG